MSSATMQPPGPALRGRRRGSLLAGGALTVVVVAGVVAAALWPGNDGPRPDGGTGPSRVVAAATDGPGHQGFPDAADTGVSEATVLTEYTGPCDIDRPGTLIENQDVNCILIIRAADVVIRDSVIRGGVDVDTDGASVTIEGSDVIGGDRAGAAVGYRNITLTGSDVSGAQHGVNCSGGCRITDSYLHDQVVADAGEFHVQPFLTSGGRDIRLLGNTLQCSAADTPAGGGCTAGVSIFGDFAPNSDVLVKGNLLVASATSGYCAYGGTDPGKPYGTEASGIRFLRNVFERGPAGTCGVFGPVTSFDPTAEGNEWTDNRWDDGDPLDLP